MLSTEKLSEILATHPRIPLVEYPTPLEHLPRLSKEISCNIFVKRDDVIGPGMGGNKTRKLEYLLADACNRNRRKVVTYGGLQSNHACITAATARKVGLEPHLFYFERRTEHLSGNLLINQILGARMHLVPIRGKGSMSLETTIRLVHWLARMIVGPHYRIPVGGHSWLGRLGYVGAALEIDDQARVLGIEDARLIFATGTGGTLAGLIAGFSLMNSQIKPLEIDVVSNWKGVPRSIAHLVNQIFTHLGQSLSLSSEKLPMIERTYAGQQ